MNTEPYRPNVDELLIDWELQRQKGTPITPEELCRACPELLDEVKQRIAEQMKVDELLATPAQSDTGLKAAARLSLGEPQVLADLATQSKFHNLRFHAKGGLGEVWIADDETLGRKVALKRIQREAEITSRLEHPGVVPVHSIGKTADDLPCYAMRSIEGQTLHEAIREFHGQPNPLTPFPKRGGGIHSSPFPPREGGRGVRFDSLAFRQLLRHFIDVCNTVAYAHSRGIIHRDLKPANIMLGAFGETWVLDWGLAKDLAAKPQGESASPAGDAPMGISTAGGTP